MFAGRLNCVIPKPVSKNVVLYTVVRALGRAYGPAGEAKPTPKPTEPPNRNVTEGEAP